MAVVKGNAWGAGTLECTKAFIDAGADWIGVTTIEDAMRLRREFDIPILLMCEPPCETISTMVGLNIVMTVYSIASARLISEAAMKHQTDIEIHIKINTGLNRVGVSAKDATLFFNEVMKLDRVKITGIFSHFSSADDPSSDTRTAKELSLFKRIIEEIKAQTGWYGMVHMANTAATMSLPESHLDMVRVSIGLMGLYSNHDRSKKIPFKQVFNWKTEVTHLIKVNKGERVGYGGYYVAQADTTLVTIPVGWADGLPKAYINGGQVLIRGLRYPIVAISMDMTCIDLAQRMTGISMGESVVIFGVQKNEMLEPMVQGRVVGIDADATLSAINTRVPRIYC